MKAIIIVAAFLCSLNLLSQGFQGHADFTAYSDSIEKSREEKKTHLLDTVEGILNSEDLEHFQGANFHPIDSSWVISARWKKKRGPKFEMPTSTERRPVYRRYGYVYFEKDGKSHRLTVYQNVALTQKEGFEDYLFLPFKDESCPDLSYGAGRYLDMKVPKKGKDSVILDFNSAYNPYCAYSHRYSCPIPPAENTLKCSVLAGEAKPTTEY